MALSAVIGHGLAWFLVWLLARAALHKMAAPLYYRQVMTRYVARAGGGLTLGLVVALEAGIALALLLPRWRDTGLVAAAVLLLVYAGLMAVRILRGGAAMQCGCAGPDSQLAVSWALVMRNGVCAGLALLAMASPAQVTGWPGAGLSLLVAVLVIFIYVGSEELISYAQWMEGDG